MKKNIYEILQPIIYYNTEKLIASCVPEIYSKLKNCRRARRAHNHHRTWRICKVQSSIENQEMNMWIWWKYIKCTIFNSAHDLSSGHRNAGSLTAGCVVSVKSSSQSWMSLDFDSRATLGSNLKLFFFSAIKNDFFPQLCAQVFFLFIDMRWKCDLMSLFRSRCTYVIASQKKNKFAQKRQKAWKITSWFRIPIPCL